MSIKTKTLSHSNAYIQQQKRELNNSCLVQPKHLAFWIVNKCDVKGFIVTNCINTTGMTHGNNCVCDVQSFQNAKMNSNSHSRV
jgi:hypothetical protein